MTNKENTKMAHNAIAEKYYKEYKDDTTDLNYIDEFLKKCNKKILDLGCGMGHYSKYMKSKGFELVGIDFSKEMLKFAKDNEPNIKFIESDICDLPQNLDKDFDGVLLAYVIQHLSKEETMECLKKLKEYIKPNANLLIFFREGNNIINEEEPFDTKYIYTIKEYNVEEITELLSECGYDVIEIKEKPFIEDENSLCPKTLILYSKNK